MPQVKTSKPLTYYIDTPIVRVFQEFAGESLNKIDAIEAWDVITVLCQAASLANQYDHRLIDVPEAIEALSQDLELSDKALECLKALDCFPVNQVHALMGGILSVAFEDE